MDWREVPSLSALRAFEAMARLGGFTTAARELNVTHAAIAQHVRGLEAELGQSLVVREGRKMGLTEAGRILAASLGEGFGAISEGVRETRAVGLDRPLQIAMTPSFAENWIMPRIGAFWAEHPEIKLALVPGYPLVDLKRDGFDLAIRYGRGGWDDVDAEYLVSAGNVVVATPELAARVPKGDVVALQKQVWLQEPGRQEPKLWAAEQGLDLSQMDVRDFTMNTMVLAATRAGYGFSLQGRALVDADLKEGRLVSVFEQVRSGLAYHMLTRRGTVTGKLKVFVEWLRANASD